MLRCVDGVDETRSALVEANNAVDKMLALF
jgi:hypothetical protein